MRDINIKESDFTPEIICNAEEGSISIAGKSCTENTLEFYEPLLQWTGEFFEKSSVSVLEIAMDVTELNSSSVKLVVQLFELLEANSQNKNIEVDWFYDEGNDSIKELGEELVEEYESFQITMIAKP